MSLNSPQHLAWEPPNPSGTREQEGAPAPEQWEWEALAKGRGRAGTGLLKGPDCFKRRRGRHSGGLGLVCQGLRGLLPSVTAPLVRATRGRQRAGVGAPSDTPLGLWDCRGPFLAETDGLPLVSSQPHLRKLAARSLVLGQLCASEGSREAWVYPLPSCLQGQVAGPAVTQLGCEGGLDRGGPLASLLPSRPCGEASDATRRAGGQHASALNGLSGGYRRALFSNKQVEDLLFLLIIPRLFLAKCPGRSHRPSTFTGVKSPPWAEITLGLCCQCSHPLAFGRLSPLSLLSAR